MVSKADQDKIECLTCDGRAESPNPLDYRACCGNHSFGCRDRSFTVCHGLDHGLPRGRLRHRPNRRNSSRNTFQNLLRGGDCRISRRSCSSSNSIPQRRPIVPRFLFGALDRCCVVVLLVGLHRNRSPALGRQPRVYLCLCSVARLLFGCYYCYYYPMQSQHFGFENSESRFVVLVRHLTVRSRYS